jgi:hypothetical protein
MDRCPLIRPSGSLPGFLLIFGSVEQLSQGDAQGQFSFPAEAPDDPSSGVFVRDQADDPPESSGANAPPNPARTRRSGANAPPDPARTRRSGANAPLNPARTRRSGANAPGLSIAAAAAEKELSAAAQDFHSAQRAAKLGFLPDPNTEQPDPDVLTLLADNDVFGQPLQVLPRCSELTATIARDVLAVCRQQGKGPGVFIKRLSDRVRIRRRNRLGQARASRPADQSGDQQRVDDALAELDRLDAEGGAS